MRGIVSSIVGNARLARKSLLVVSMLIAVAAATPSACAYSTLGTVAAAAHVSQSQSKTMFALWVPAQPNQTVIYGMPASASPSLP